MEARAGFFTNFWVSSSSMDSRSSDLARFGSSVGGGGRL